MAYIGKYNINANVELTLENFSGQSPDSTPQIRISSIAKSGQRSVVLDWSDMSGTNPYTYTYIPTVEANYLAEYKIIFSGKVYVYEDSFVVESSLAGSENDIRHIYVGWFNNDNKIFYMPRKPDGSPITDSAFGSHVVVKVWSGSSWITYADYTIVNAGYLADGGVCFGILFGGEFVNRYGGNPGQTLTVMVESSDYANYPVIPVIYEIKNEYSENEKYLLNLLLEKVNGISNGSCEYADDWSNPYEVGVYSYEHTTIDDSRNVIAMNYSPKELVWDKIENVTYFSDPIGLPSAKKARNKLCNILYDSIYAVRWFRYGIMMLVEYGGIYKLLMSSIGSAGKTLSFINDGILDYDISNLYSVFWNDRLGKMYLLFNNSGNVRIIVVDGNTLMSAGYWGESQNVPYEVIDTTIQIADYTSYIFTPLTGVARSAFAVDSSENFAIVDYSGGKVDIYNLRTSNSTPLYTINEFYASVSFDENDRMYLGSSVANGYQSNYPVVDIYDKAINGTVVSQIVQYTEGQDTSWDVICLEVRGGVCKYYESDYGYLYTSVDRGFRRIPTLSDIDSKTSKMQFDANNYILSSNQTGDGVVGSIVVSINVKLNTGGVPIPDVTVTVKNSDGSVDLTRVVTDTNGVATVGLDAGDYQVVLSKAGYVFTVPETITVDVNNNSFDLYGDELVISVPTAVDACTVYEFGYTQDDQTPLPELEGIAKIVSLPYDYNGKLHTGKQMRGEYDSSQGIIYWQIVYGATVDFRIPDLGVNVRRVIPSVAQARLSEIT